MVEKDQLQIDALFRRIENKVFFGKNKRMKFQVIHAINFSQTSFILYTIPWMNIGKIVFNQKIIIMIVVVIIIWMVGNFSFLPIMGN